VKEEVADKLYKELSGVKKTISKNVREEIAR